MNENRKTTRLETLAAAQLIRRMLNNEATLEELGRATSYMVTASEYDAAMIKLDEVTDESVLFIFDDYITERPMNESNTNVGGYEESDLKKWIEGELFSKFPVELKARLVELTIPTVGQVISWDDEWDKEHFEADGDEQLPLMKLRKNRVAYLNNECKWGWLRNATKKECSSADFAIVNDNGGAICSHASYSYGVRPEFRLVK